MSGGPGMNVIDSQMSLIYYAELSILQIRGLFFVLSIFCLVAMVALYRKGGRHGWEVFVPFYCYYVMCDMVYGDGWLFIIRFIPIPAIRTIFSLYTLYQFSKLYGCGTVMALGCTFFPYIFMPILAWGNGHSYIGSK